MGSEDANLVEFPYLVQLLVWNAGLGNYHFKCGGTIITSGWVLTAAHRLVSDNNNWIKHENFHVIIGSEYQDETGGDRYHNENYFFRANYDYRTHANDIALLKVKN